MVKHGIKGIIGGGAAAGGASSGVINAWREALARGGRETEPGGDLILGLSFHIAETVEKAIEEARPHFEENMKMFAPPGFVRGLTDEQIEALADSKRAPCADLPTLEDAVEAGSWLCGPPELIVEKISALQELYPGLEELNMSLPVGTPQTVLLEQLQRFGEEVMPAFKGKPATPAAV